jgi:hypothetical protein
MMMKFDKNNFEYHKYLNVVENDDYKQTYLFVEQVDNMLVDNMMSKLIIIYKNLVFNF